MRYMSWVTTSVWNHNRTAALAAAAEEGDRDGDRDGTAAAEGMGQRGDRAGWR